MKESRAVVFLRRTIVAAGLLLPLASLVPLGSLWLWQNGLLIYWAAAALVLTAAAYVLQRWLLRREAAQSAAPAPEALPPEERSDPLWSPREEAAWQEVRRVAETADIAALTSRERALTLGLDTVRAVAQRMHPDDPNPLLRFTVPEALALIERVSARLGPLVADTIPLGDQLTVRQVLQVYRWRGLVDAAERTYDVWRVIRLLNPLAAVAAEMRESLQKQLFTWGRERLARRLAQTYVREVGRAAIDLYGGRLRIRSAADLSAASRRDKAAAPLPDEPLRLLVAGQISAGKSSLVNALAGGIQAAVDVLPSTDDLRAYELSWEGQPAALIVDSPGIGTPAAIERLMTAVPDCDLLVWLGDATRADREPDARALAAVRAHFAARPDRRLPPILLVLTHIDRLRPFGSWEPPYDLDLPDDETPAGRRRAAIRSASQAWSSEVGIEAGRVIPVCLADPPGLYNLEAVWRSLLQSLPEARRAQLLRRLNEARPGLDVSRIWSQTLAAGKALARGLGPTG